MALLAKGVKASRRSLIKHPITYVLLVATFVTVGAGIVVRVIEANRGSHINSLTDAFWWAIYDLSTLGSNDYRPTTNWGRGLEIILALLGLGLFALLAGSLGAFFVDKEENAETQHDYEQISERLGRIEAALAKLAPASGGPEGASVDDPQDSE
jgi:voltage-gated potassium channel